MDPQQIMSRLKELFSSFHPAQLASLVGAFLLVVGVVVGSAWWVNAPTYGLLFSDMDPETASEIVTRLKTLKVSYQLDAGRACDSGADRSGSTSCGSSSRHRVFLRRGALDSSSSIARRSAPPSSSSR